MGKKDKPEPPDVFSPVRDWRDSIPLTLKMVLLALFVGISLSIVSDFIHNKYLKKTIEERNRETIKQLAAEQRMRFDFYVKKYFKALNLFAAQKRFNDYLDHHRYKAWSKEGDITIEYHSLPPRWFPDRAIMRTFMPSLSSSFVILLDAQQRVREVYKKGMENPPEFFLRPDSFLYRLSQGQSFLTSINNVPYIVASKGIFGPEGRQDAILAMACPIDDTFLVQSQGVLSSKTLIALTTGFSPHIIASNNREALPVGTSIDSIKDRFLVEEEGFFDYGNSDLLINLATFFPKSDIESQTAVMLSKERIQQAVTSVMFILAFAFVMYWVTRHIENITRGIDEFSRKTLGLEPKSLPKGDQLHILRERFHYLTEEVAEAREIIKKQAEEQTRLIVDNAFDAIITTDDKGTITTWNPRAEVIFGWTQAEAVGQIIYDMVISTKSHKECRKALKHIINEWIRSRSNRQIEITFHNREGREFPVELSVSPARSGDSHIFIFIIRDITERKRSEKKIKNLLVNVTKSQAEWELTFNSVTEQIMLVDKELNIIRCNKSFADFAEKSVDEIVGSKCHGYLLCGQTWLDMKDEFQVRERSEVKTDDGRWLYVSYLPVFDEKGGFLYTIITATDITELKRIQHSLTESRMELKERVEDLENFYDMAVNRELKMKALKKEISELRSVNDDQGNAFNLQKYPSI